MDDESISAEEPAPESVERLTCFVIGPIGSRLAKVGTSERDAYEEALNVVEEVILPACEHVGLSPVRADGLTRAGEITDQVFRRLRDDDVVIADVSGANANVMYELGMRHTRDKLTVQIGEYGRLPFDVNVIRTIQFSRSPMGLINARNELIQVLEAGLAGEYDRVSATRVWIEAEGEPSATGDGEANDSTTAPAEEEEPPGFLDLVAAAEEGQERLIATMNALAEALAQVGAAAEQGAADIHESDAKGGGMRGRLTAAIRFANGLSSVADSVEDLVDDYVSAMADVSAGNIAIIERLEEDPSQLEEREAEEFGLVIRGLARTAREVLASLSEFADSMEENAKISRVLREPTNKFLRAIRKFGETTAVADQWDRRLQALGVPVPPPDWEPTGETPEAGADATT